MNRATVGTLALLFLAFSSPAGAKRLAGVASATASSFNVGSDAEPIKLNEQQLAQALRILGDPSLTRNPPPKCWNPHHRIDLFDRKGARLGSVEVCFECDAISSSSLGPSGALTARGAKAYRELFASLGIAINPVPDDLMLER